MMSTTDRSSLSNKGIEWPQSELSMPLSSVSDRLCKLSESSSERERQKISHQRYVVMLHGKHPQGSARLHEARPGTTHLPNHRLRPSPLGGCEGCGLTCHPAANS